MYNGMANGAGPDQNIGGDLGMPAENGFQGNNMMGGEAAPRNTPAGPRPGGGGRNRMDSEFVEGKLFLGGLDNATTKETLLAYVRQWGEVNDYVLMPGRGFGFVTYADAAAAQAFLEHREHVIDGKKVEAKAAVPKNSSSGSSLTKKMFVGGTGDIDDDTFRQYFEQFGDIDDCVILRKPDGGSRGFGFVTYKDEMSVEKCLVMQHSLNGRTVELKRAIRKEDMAPGSTGTTYAGSSGGGSGGPVRGGKQPDWTCPDCRNKNFGWREVCNRCGINKPMGAGQMNGGRGGGAGMGGGFNQPRFDNPMAPMGSMGMAPMGGMGMGQMGGMGAMGMNPMAQMGGMGMGMTPMGGYGMGQMGNMGYGMGMGMTPMGMYPQSGYAAQPQQAPQQQQQQQQQGGYGRSGGGGRGGGAQRYRPY